MHEADIRGYFGVGVEGAGNPMNWGNLMRSAHAFGADFVFTIAAHSRIEAASSDTSNTPDSIPLHAWDTPDDLALPAGCALVGVELTDEAVPLPRFTHPRRAAYVLGPERGTLSPEMLEKCAAVVRIPTRFCLNVQIAGAVVMYDRLITLGRARTGQRVP